MTKIIIGCPSLNDLEPLQAMLSSLISSTDSYDKIVIVDGGSVDGTKEYLNNLVRNYKRIEVLYPNIKTPLEAYNILFDLALNEKADLFLTQTDVVFPKLYKRDWLQIMHDIGQLETVGVVTSINGCGTSGPDYIDGFNWLGGWCTYVPYNTLEKVGKFDDSFPNGNGVDIDWSWRICLTGLKTIQIQYWCDHHMMNSRIHENNPKAEEQRKESALYFRKKWKIGEFKDGN